MPRIVTGSQSAGTSKRFSGSPGRFHETLAGAALEVSAAPGGRTGGALSWAAAGGSQSKSGPELRRCCTPNGPATQVQ